MIKDGKLKADDQLKEKQIEKINDKAFQMLVNGVTSLDEVYSLLTNV